MSHIIAPQHVSTVDATAILRNVLIGRNCTSVERAEYSWHFGFDSDEGSLTLECPWRLLAEDSIAYGCEDDGQTFGLPGPVDGVAVSKELLGSSLISLVDIRQGCGDLSIGFANGVRLEVFNGSSGYEGWNYTLKDELVVVGQAGGRLAVWNTALESR